MQEARLQHQQQQLQPVHVTAKDDHGHKVKSDVDFVLEGTGCQVRCGYFYVYLHGSGLDP